MSVTRALFLSLALPLSLAAQQPAAAPIANPVTSVFQGRTIGLQWALGQAFDSIPESKFGYKPTPVQLTVGAVAQHLANDNYFFCNQFGKMQATRPDKETATPDSVKARWPKDTLVAQLKASFTFCEKALTQLDDAKLGEQITVTYHGQSQAMPRAQMALGHVVDMADHYSQIANYMRLNGLIPPTARPRPATK